MIDEKEIRSSKLLNSSSVRRICKNNGIRISDDAIEDLTVILYVYILDAISVARETGYRTILHRHVKDAPENRQSREQSRFVGGF